MKLKELALLYVKELGSEQSEDETIAIFRLVASHTMGWGYGKYTLHQNEEVDFKKQAFFMSALEKLKTNIPLQYILGETEFYGLRFKVNPSVLIPRPETEELVKLIIDRVGVGKNELNILDIGTGSGCIAISLKKNLPKASLFATDIAEDSLEIARHNAMLNNVEVSFIDHDILSKGSINGLKFDVIVSNPPYITEDEKTEMHQNVLANEPHRALFVSNENPLIFYKAITDFAQEHLNPNGFLFFEINEFLGKETLNMIRDKAFSNSILFRDMQGKYRMIQASR